MYIGYLVPEFPSQTHAFFWREIDALQRQGVTVDVVSTRRPTRTTAPHPWAEDAIARTTYLYPLSWSQAIQSCWQQFKSGPAYWWKFVTASLGVRRASVRMFGLAMLGAKLALTARHRGWTHLHVHSCADAAHIALFCHLLSGLPYSLTLHGDLAGYGPNQSLKWKHAAFAVVVCDALAKQVTREIGSHLPAHVATAPMGVDTQTFRRTSEYQPFRGKGPLRVFSCGRLHPGKGHEDLLHAIARVRRRGRNLTLVIAGDDGTGGQYKARLESIINDLGLNSCVQLAGALSEHAVRDHLERAHVFMLASHDEALGVATMEAMAMQLPVIVSRIGGVPELVTHGVEGLLVEPRNPNRLAAALTTLSHLPQRCIAMGEQGCRKIAEHYHSGISARVILDEIARVGHDRASCHQRVLPVQ